MKTRHISTTRNIPLGELYDTRHYLLPSGEKVSVKTLCEMGYADPHLNIALTIAKAAWNMGRDLDRRMETNFKNIQSPKV